MAFIEAANNPEQLALFFSLFATSSGVAFIEAVCASNQPVDVIRGLRHVFGRGLH